jgi:hypothetical protein
MKIIITEEQYNKIALRRRFQSIMDEGSYIVDNGDDFYGDLDFCLIYPKFNSFIESMVDDIIHQFDNETEFGIWEFIHKDIGLETFINMLMEEHGAKIRSFYNRKTKDC